MRFQNIINVNRKKIVSIIFFVIIATPLLLQVLGEWTGYSFDYSLNGYTDIYEKPKASLKEWMKGEYQKQYSDWVSNNFVTRGLGIKNYNQIRYSLFDIGNGKQVIGKDHYIFQQPYIDAYLCLNEDNNYIYEGNKNKLQKYVGDLVEIDHKLKKVGKKLFFYITPSKARYFSDKIPDRYYKMSGSDSSLSGYEYLKYLLTETDLNYLDSNQLFKDSSVDISFYSTGIHWSRPFEQVTDKKIIEALSDCSGEQYRNIELGGLNSSYIPYWRDSDVQDLLNIFTAPKETYYEYVSNIDVEEYKPLRALLQGGSFAQGLITDYFDESIDSSLYYINYNKHLYDNNTGDHQTISEWDDVDFQKLLDGSDWVIIELNEAVISNYSDGFVEYLDNYLDSYVPRKQELADNFVPSQELSRTRARGYYGYEDTYRWTTNDSSLTLYNERIAEEGLKIEFVVPDQLVVEGSVTVKIFVNGQMCTDETYTDFGDYCVNIKPEKIESKKDTYCIEIVSSKCFVPSELGNSTDSRVLSLKMKYIGENE
ncbi:hypothetical protein D6853_13170 [Butyrivibrio sp. X503]|uniref:hypothetical protein n=1 Tax=Butyrivibrio sp. X503 TaxID=2364878 RepID=UPI000EC6762B|nr:hypothetical protein [Butyrivibrio sp. X503]RKM54472.1 hypothetical protein D6853_13170 [Butyrivibrio sp. X503]